MTSTPIRRAYSALAVIHSEYAAPMAPVAIHTPSPTAVDAPAARVRPPTASNPTVPARRAAGTSRSNCSRAGGVLGISTDS